MNKLLWSPSKDGVKNSNMYRFMQVVNKRYDQDLCNFESLYTWSIKNIPEFWGLIFEFAEIKASGERTLVVDDLNKMPGSVWFPNIKLNFAENLLRYRDEQTAIIFKQEDRACTKLTYRQLYTEVARLTASLRSSGVQPGDRVVGFMPNIPETIIAMLAATSMGAIWSSCSPDLGKRGVLDRFGQIKPKVLFAADGYRYKGKEINSLDILSEIGNEIPSIQTLVVIPYNNETPAIDSLPNAVLYEEYRSQKSDLTIAFESLPFSHPLYIMYSSGTTGLPKCLVQSAGGILINQLKELILHTDVRREDTIFYFTTCGWMMWNWLTCSLATGATLVLFDGNPFYPDPASLWELAQDEKITIFGTSAGYLASLQKAGTKPGKEYRLDSLRTILSTGSPLSEESFDYVYKEIKQDLQLCSISGGTDLNGCFALGNPLEPVYRGELQCRGLGMKVEAFDEAGQSVIGQQGELVCTAPFPSMPIYFWDDPDGRKYHHAYFDVYPNIWRHGDYIEINQRGGIVIHGRSDATLNPGGVRIGTADIYRHVENMDEIADSIVVGQQWENDIRIVLFVQLAEAVLLTDELKSRIQQTIRENLSPRHIPAMIVSVPEIPYTLNMKKVELAVRNIIHNKPVLNKDSLKNPESLHHFKELKELT